MLQRKALKQFQAWHDAPSHTALLVTGARQVGKTYLIREFADQHYESFAEFNFIQNPDAARIFNHSVIMTFLLGVECRAAILRYRPFSDGAGGVQPAFRGVQPQ